MTFTPPEVSGFTNKRKERKDMKGYAPGVHENFRAECCAADIMEFGETELISGFKTSEAKRKKAREHWRKHYQKKKAAKLCKA